MAEELGRWLMPSVAVLAILVAVAQYELGRRQWLLGLYEKRYPVFIETMKYLAEVGARAQISQEVLDRFLRRSRDHWLLFGEDVGEHLWELYEKGLRLQAVRQVREAQRGGEEEHARLVRQEAGLVDWFAEQMGETRRVFGRYLQVGKKGRARWGRVGKTAWTMRESLEEEEE